MKSFDPWSTILTDTSGDIVWPQPYYGHSFYREVPSWIHYGDNGTKRLLFDGAFIGAEAPAAGTGDPLQMLEVITMMQPYVHAGHHMGAEVPPLRIEPRKGLLAEAAPHVAPAMGPIAVKKVFDEGQVLHVEICVDGKCYRTSMNLGPAIRLVMEKLAQWHKDQHAAMVQHAGTDQQQPAITDIVGAIESAIGAAGDAMVDTLFDRHVNVGSGGTSVGIWPGYLYLAAAAAGAGAGVGFLSNYSRGKQREADIAAAREAFSRRDREWRELIDQRDRLWGADYEGALRALAQASPSAFENYMQGQGVRDSGQPTVGW